MTVTELIKLLQSFDPEKKVAISCEGGCVEDENITIFDTGDKVILEIE